MNEEVKGENVVFGPLRDLTHSGFCAEDKRCCI